MYRCEYCNRYLKKKYDKCPACGSTTFKKMQNYDEMVIKTPPKDGYILNLENYKLERKDHKVGMMIGFYILGFILLFCIPFILIPLLGGFDLISLVFVIFGLLFLIEGFSVSKMFFNKSKEIRNKADKSIDKVEELSKHGMLIKNLKYTIKPVDKKINGQKTIYKIRVIYEIEKGRTMCFDSEPKYLSALGRDDGTVDLLIDPNDYSNYFIDFEIY